MFFDCFFLDKLSVLVDPLTKDWFISQIIHYDTHRYVKLLQNNKQSNWIIQYADGMMLLAKKHEIF